MCSGYYLMNIPALLNRSNIGCGIIPSTKVAVAVAATVMVVKIEGMATDAVFSLGAEKNMTTITRT
jgi:hypothetical protein